MDELPHLQVTGGKDCSPPGRACNLLVATLTLRHAGRTSWQLAATSIPPGWAASGEVAGRAVVVVEVDARRHGGGYGRFCAGAGVRERGLGLVLEGREHGLQGAFIAREPHGGGSERALHLLVGGGAAGGGHGLLHNAGAVAHARRVVVVELARHVHQVGAH